ncbi:MAG: hypothetical protein AB3N28_08245, partial [Kordiimonas sp.]
AALIFTCAFSAYADEFILSVDKGDDAYFATLLEAALNAADGEHIFSTYTYDRSIPQSRILRAMLAGDAPVNVLFTGHSIQREQLLKQIDIPLLRGLLGYRLLAIHKDSADHLAPLNTLKELTHNIRLGSGTSWPDTYILRAAGFKIETGTVDNLWRMLHRRRFDALPMGINEIYGELARFKQSTPSSDLMIEQSIMLHYRFDHFFYVAPHDQRRALIIEQGLERLYANGEFMRIFNEAPSIKAAIAEAKKYKRTIIEIENPLNSDRVSAIPSKYWHSFED